MLSYGIVNRRRGGVKAGLGGSLEGGAGEDGAEVDDILPIASARAWS
jgi:hypothetical protein